MTAASKKQQPPPVEIEATVDAAGATTPQINGRGEADYATLGDFLASPQGSVVVHPEAVLDDKILNTLLSAETVAISFPTFADGRGYSHARRIRDAGYAGVIVAYGDIGLDQLHYLKRSGCDRFALRKGTDLAKVAPTFARFEVQYVGIRGVTQG